MHRNTCARTRWLRGGGRPGARADRRSSSCGRRARRDLSSCRRPPRPAPTSAVAGRLVRITYSPSSAASAAIWLALALRRRRTSSVIVELEVLGHAGSVDDPAHAQRDRPRSRCAAARAALRGLRGDLVQLAPRWRPAARRACARVRRRAAGCGTRPGARRGSARCVDLGQVALVKERELERSGLGGAACAICGARSALIQSDALAA